MRPQQLTDAALVGGVGVAVQQADGDAFNALGRQFVRQRDDLRFIQRGQHLAARIDPFRYAMAPGSGDQRLWLVQKNVVLRESVFQANLDQVAKAGRRQQGGAGTLALDQRVGGQRGAQDQQADVGPAQARLVQQFFNALQHGGFRRFGCGQQLGGPAMVVVFQNNVGERAAHVDGDAHG
ncbi:hypothetical protein D3C86_1062530 [compost metagenome]